MAAVGQMEGACVNDSVTLADESGKGEATQEFFSALPSVPFAQKESLLPVNIG